MFNAIRILSALISLLSTPFPADARSTIFSVAPLAPSATGHAVEEHQWREPQITYAHSPTRQQRETIEWAVNRYHAAGLQLPDLEIRFPQQCSGKAALYFIGRRQIDFCDVAQRFVLHEFAHAWDDTVGHVDRQGFLELRGLTVWWGGTELKSAEQGAEHLAEIIAWGLMGADPQRVPKLPHNSVAELARAFEFLTGQTLQTSGDPTAPQVMFVGLSDAEQASAENSCKELHDGYVALTGREPLRGYTKLCEPSVATRPVGEREVLVWRSAGLRSS